MPSELDVIARYAQPQQTVDMQAWPLALYAGHVHDDWVDYNGHMNEGFSVFVMGYACDTLANLCGAMPKGAMFTAETHVSYHAEVPRGAAFTLTGRLLQLWPKRWQTLFHLYLGETLAVTIEQMSIYTEQGKVSTFPTEVYATLEDLLVRHQAHPTSPYAGRKVGDPKVVL